MSSKKNKQVEKAILASLGGAALPVIGAMGLIILVVVAILAAAGSILGWLWGGGSPSEEGSAQKTPSGEVQFWTPTPIPEPCFVTPTPVRITLRRRGIPGRRLTRATRRYRPGSARTARPSIRLMW